ncbi:uncharacterized protein LOC108337007 [Vigna angularis]|uniref:uncharacterized protein LOC108337007 n=1 Tax=Phaseolus angularis TaxID=3914 RepID=UPI0022B2EE8E|nr:uncharacterized protein LOC108337007 [Vigna angularis]
MDEQQSIGDLIAQMQAQIQAQARTIQAQAKAQQELQRKHAEEIATLWLERVHTERSASNQENENERSRNRQSSQHTNPNGRGRKESSPLRTGWSSSLLPFTSTIMQTPMPEKNPLVLDKYDGSADPDNHLRIFTNAMAFYTDSDLVICRAFSLSLKDEALEWYNTLPPNTMDCFATVETLFRRQYASNRKQEITPMELVNTKQEKDETLKAFMKRNNEVARRVKDVNHTFIISNLPSCLRPGYFAEKLYVRPQKTMKELQERVAEFIRMEDMRISQRKKQQEVSAGGNKKESRQSFNNNDRNGDTFHKDFVRTPMYNHYTPLNAPRVKVLEETLNIELLTIWKKSSPKDVDETKSCQFHLNRGHTTEECDALKDEIERLIRGGHLQKFVGERTRTKSPIRENSQHRETERSYQRAKRRHRRSNSRSRSPYCSVRGRID